MATSSTLSSPSNSPHFGPSSTRRVSARRGSQSASDPFGAHMELNHHAGRNIASRLTIVRVQDAAEEPPALDRRHSLQHRRNGSGHSVHRHGQAHAGSGDPPRLSFASSSFNRPGGSRPGSPTTQRPHSPVQGTLGHHRPSPTGTISKFKLSPEDIVRLAHEATHPAYHPPTSAGSIKSASSVSTSPVMSPIASHHTAAPPPTVAPASFTPLPDTIWLPFIDRPSEVATLISHTSTARLFALLAQTLTSPSTASIPVLPLPADSSTWTFAQLEQWLTRVDRDEADDRVWVRKARICVLAHSELIWERIKGALGVPPELDTSEETAEEKLDRMILGDENAVESDPESEPSVFRLGEAHSPAPAATATATASITVEDAGADVFEEDFDDLDVVVIEPVVVPTSPPAAAPSHGDGLGDIGEEDEDEAEDGTGTPSQKAPKEEIVQGLSICTSPQPAGAVGLVRPAVSPFALAASPSQPFGLAGTSPSPSVLHLDPAAGQLPGAPGVAGQSPGAPPSVSPLVQASAPRARSFSSSSWGSGRGQTGYYDVVGERGPGNPLFPSSFAQLALAPTLSAK